jgi:hypothetical protein
MLSEAVKGLHRAFNGPIFFDNVFARFSGGEDHASGKDGLVALRFENPGSLK